MASAAGERDASQNPSGSNAAAAKALAVPSTQAGQKDDHDSQGKEAGEKVDHDAEGVQQARQGLRDRRVSRQRAQLAHADYIQEKEQKEAVRPGAARCVHGRTGGRCKFCTALRAGEQKAASRPLQLVLEIEDRLDQLITTELALPPGDLDNLQQCPNCKKPMHWLGRGRIAGLQRYDQCGSQNG